MLGSSDTEGLSAQSSRGSGRLDRGEEVRGQAGVQPPTGDRLVPRGWSELLGNKCRGSQRATGEACCPACRPSGSGMRAPSLPCRAGPWHGVAEPLRPPTSSRRSLNQDALGCEPQTPLKAAKGKESMSAMHWTLSGRNAVSPECGHVGLRELVVSQCWVLILCQVGDLRGFSPSALCL